MTSLHSTTRVLPVSLPGPAPAPRRPDADRALAELHERHEAELTRFCRWMLKDRDDASDALQETWVRAMTALRDDGIRVAAPRPWLFAIARNVCLDLLRDRKRRTPGELDDNAAPGVPGADEVLAIRQEADAALALVGALSERQRAALLMRELAGMSVPDIAEALGLSVSRAHWTIADARRALDEARSGTSLACDEVRTRAAAGHRNRAVRSHLAQCSGCQAHDRRQRSRRVLAPALIPFLWLRRAALPGLVSPATVAGVVALSVPFAAVDPPAAEPARAAMAAPAPRAERPEAVTAVRAGAAAPKRRATPRASAPAPIAAPARVRATPAPAQQAPAPPQAPPAPVVELREPVAVAPAVKRVETLVDDVAAEAATVLAVTAPVVDVAQRTVSELLP